MAATLSDLNGPGIHLSGDGGRSFERRSAAVHAGALAERDGVLYASTDNFLDGFALARSSDGRDWEPLTRYADVTGTRTCPAGARIAQTCSALCIEQVVRGVFDEQTCGPARLPPPPPDAGPSPDPMVGTGGGGCGCRIDGGGTPSPALALLILLVVVGSLRWGQRVAGAVSARARRRAASGGP